MLTQGLPRVGPSSFPHLIVLRPYLLGQTETYLSHTLPNDPTTRALTLFLPYSVPRQAVTFGRGQCHHEQNPECGEPGNCDEQPWPLYSDSRGRSVILSVDHTEPSLLHFHAQEPPSVLL